MTDRERLIEILKLGSCPSPYLCDENCKYANLERCYEERTADLLLEHGVIVPPCKVGDTVYSIEMHIVDKWVKYKVCEIPFSLTLWENGWEDIFLTREEAERALKERENNA